MDIHINTNKSVESNERMEAFFKEEIAKELSIFNEHITRIELHLSDENGPKANVDEIVCKMEGRLKGRQPIAVTSKGGKIEKAVSGATAKLKSAIQTRIGKATNH